MSLLLVGVSHRTAPLALLDQIAANTDSIATLRSDIAASPFVAEVMVVSTCNRIEVTADVVRFHGAVTDITERLSKHSGIPLDELTQHLYVHFEERAVHHMFSVASGLESMIVGEQQILGQVRAALRSAQDAGNTNRSLNELGQSALRVGKRIHTETGIDRHGASVVSVALDEATRILGSLSGRRGLVIGAGAMSSLALQTLATRDLGDLAIASRTLATTQRTARSVGASAITLAELPEALRDADVVVSATGAHGLVINYQDVLEATKSRTDRPLIVIDLALPHDTDPLINEIVGVTRVGLSDLAEAPGASAPQADLEMARSIVEAEVRDFLAAQAALRVEPIVVSLRAKADVVLEAELQRLRLKLPQLSDEVIAAVERAMRRTVSTLLHTPTVRMKQFAADPGGQRYAEALHALFDLDPESVTSLSSPTAEALDAMDRRDGPPTDETRWLQ